jgi:hypothetical protein
MLAKSALPFGDSREGLSLAYSPNLVEEEFCELRSYGVLRGPHSPDPTPETLRGRGEVLVA